MVIKPNHKNVDAEGLVYLPYLFNWNPNSSTLRELVLIMCGVFGQEPPLFSRVGQASLQPQAVQATSINNSPAPLSASRPNSSQYDKFLSPSIHAASPPSYAAATATSAGVQLPIPEHLKEQQTQRDKERLLRDVTSQLHEAIIMTQTRLKGSLVSCFDSPNGW